MGSAVTCEKGCCGCNDADGDPVTLLKASDEGHGGKGDRYTLPEAYETQAKDRQSRVPFEVVLVRTGPLWQSLGLYVSPDDDPTVLSVDNVYGPSLISEWNAAHEPNLNVRVGDVIETVNGITGGAQMLHAIQALGHGSTAKLMVR
mmetsp:Transcript_71235/g.154817  ORF Transcript_71235/g.154817 Transcript_71235/m.154817 type:complete len:146 (-) Transcript_71235:104-541(-)